MNPTKPKKSLMRYSIICKSVMISQDVFEKKKEIKFFMNDKFLEDKSINYEEFFIFGKFYEKNN
jgi:hypothetical protein